MSGNTLQVKSESVNLILDSLKVVPGVVVETNLNLINGRGTGA